MTSSRTNDKFKQIDNALAQYYKRLRIKNYYDENRIGLFLNLVTGWLDDPSISIEDELGYHVYPYDCNYLEMDGQFPLPPYVQISDDQAKSFIFYIIQYCYKYNKPP
eukprot:267843_1